MNERVPEDWTTEDLDKSLISLPKSSHPSSISNKNGYYNFYVCSSDIQRSFKCDKTGPAVLFSTGGEAAIHYATGEYSYSTDVWATKYSKNLTNEFVFRFIELNISRINNLGFQGSGIKHLDKDYIKKIKITYPPLPEQKKIASILTSVDEVIEKTQLQINKLQDLKKGTMNELLTRGIGHTEFKDSELGRIPKSWEVKFLSEITLKIGDGIHSTPKYSDTGKFPFINGNNLQNGEIYFDKSTKMVNKSEFEKHKTNLHKGTLLLSINGTIGNLAFYKGESVVLGKSAAYLIFIPDFVLPFAYYLLSSDRVKKFFNYEITGTTIRNLSLKSIKSTLVGIPSTLEQKKISNIISSIDLSIKNIQNKLSQTQSLKKSLMQDLLTGKVRVTVN